MLMNGTIHWEQHSQKRNKIVYFYLIIEISYVIIKWSN